MQATVFAPKFRFCSQCGVDDQAYCNLSASWYMVLQWRFPFNEVMNSVTAYFPSTLSLDKSPPKENDTRSIPWKSQPRCENW